MKIKGRLLGGMAAAVTAACMVSNANAVSIILDYGSHHFANGGEFVVRATTSADSIAFVNGIKANYNPLATFNGGFETFCIEYNEHFSPGSPYNTQINPLGMAIKGGTETGDPVSVGSAYLYSLFAKGTLTGYTYTDAAQAGHLQNTFWWLENERMSLPGGSFIANPGTFDSLLTLEFGADQSIWKANSATVNGEVVNAGSYGVSALNMGAASTYLNQDQLVYLGGGRQAVPDGGTTLMLLGMAMGGLSMLKRKLA